jgi:hypothetical protein
VLLFQYFQTVSPWIARFSKLKLEPSLAAASIGAPQSGMVPLIAVGRFIVVERPFDGERSLAAQQ